MNLKLKSFIYSLAVLFLFSCETLDINPKDSPNALTATSSDPDLLLNAIQIGLKDGFRQLSDEGSQLTRMTAMTSGTLYNNAYSPDGLDVEWRAMYSTLLADIEALVPLATQRELYNHVGIAKIIKAYSYTLLVDFFGDVPFSEAIQGIDNLNPARTASADIYAACITLLDEAAVELDKTVKAGGPDLYFGNTTDKNIAKWKKLANTLKFRMYVQTRLVDNTAAAKAQALATDANLISAATDDFVFEYGTNLANPDSRNPLFAGDYDNGGGVYQSLGYMNRFSSNSDPRLRYYFYRQETTNTSDVNEKRCVTQTKPSHFATSDVYCQIAGGYWGRDHGDAAGIPPDNLLRTIYGVYPAGGRFDANNDERGLQSGSQSGAGGRGIEPIMPSFLVDFLRAEAALTMSTGEDARALLKRGIEASMAKVIGFGTRDNGYQVLSIDTNNDTIPDATPQGQYEPHDTTRTNYVNTVLTAYDAAAVGTGAGSKLDIVITEMYKAGYGNGVDAYNAYRRTGLPSGMQPTLILNTSSPFANTLFYPSVYVTTNSNAPQRTFGETVFWQDATIANSLK